MSRFTIRTHTGELMGPAPTGRRVPFRGTDMVRIREDRPVEVWHEGNDVEILMQLGVPAAAT